MTKDYEKSRISVIPDDCTVIVDGVAHVIHDFTFDNNLHALQWHPGLPVPGFIARKYGDSHGFTAAAFDAIKPYVEAWERVDQAERAAAAAARVELEKRAAEREAEADAFEQERQRQAERVQQRRAHDEALYTLHMTDHEVLKAAEHVIMQLASGWGPPEAEFAQRLTELIRQRQAARETIKQERVRLGIKP